jgi:hypothetical protein
MLLEAHLQIESCELTHVSMSKGVLSSENWSDFKDSVQVSHNSHLFVELRRLSKTGLMFEVFKLENIGSSLRASSNKFRRVNFDEFILVKEFSEKLANTLIENLNLNK